MCEKRNIDGWAKKVHTIKRAEAGTPGCWGGEPAVCGILETRKGRMHFKREGMVSIGNALEESSEIHSFTHSPDIY